MQVVLNQDVKKLGYRGDIVTVKPGYFRNFLMPQGLADAATAARAKVAESRQASRVMKKEQVMENAKEVLAQLKGLKVTVAAKVSDKGKLYAGVNEDEVSAAIEAAVKVKLDKDNIKMEHFKDLGEHKALIHLGPDMEVEVSVTVEAAK